jgi:hypothetical protein
VSLEVCYKDAKIPAKTRRGECLIWQDIRPPRSLSNIMGIQPFRPEDLSRLAEIECLCNLTDPLAQYMAMDIRKNWTAHIDASAQFLAKKILEPGCVCWVMTIDSPTARHSNGEEVAAWAIWTRHGTGRPSSNEHRHSSSFAEGRIPLDKE